jgi:hypothetical protein
MTEAEWLACDDPREMMAQLDSRGSERKRRLFAAAWYRHWLESNVKEEAQEAILLAERDADGQLDEAELKWQEQAGSLANLFGAPGQWSCS